MAKQPDSEVAVESTQQPQAETQSEKQKQNPNYRTLEEFSIHSERFSKPVEFSFQKFPEEQSREEYLRHDFNKIEWLKLFSQQDGVEIFVDINRLQEQKKLDTDNIISIRGKIFSDPDQRSQGSYGILVNDTHIFLLDVNCNTNKVLRYTSAASNRSVEYHPKVFHQNNLPWTSCDQADSQTSLMEERFCKIACKGLPK